MANNRDDKFEGTDDSEYHFSDEEEASYEVENETQQAVPASSKGNAVSRLAGSRRMIISIVVFLAIVFVVYKVISPSSSTPPPTELTATPVQTNVAQTNATRTIPVNPLPKQVTTPARVAEIMTPAGSQAPQAVSQPGSPVAALPAVIPVQSAEPADSQSTAEAMGSYIEDKSKNLNAASQQAIDNMQAQYGQQLNQFQEQNKNLQNQVQTLSSRVADMEAQINQLVQVLTRRSHAASSPASSSGSSMNAQPAVEQARGPDVKIAYNVQAIIPGRAWLKADNGETVTVAEGDMIRGVGRVTKIDPYDGVVEINTGTKAVSLSYGNGG